MGVADQPVAVRDFVPFTAVDVSATTTVARKLVVVSRDFVHPTVVGNVAWSLAASVERVDPPANV